MRRLHIDAWYSEDLNTWIKKDGGLYTVGITDLAQKFIGQAKSICFENKEGGSVTKDSVLAIIESDKSTIEVTAPVSGEISRCNFQLLTETQLINHDCYGADWLIQMNMIPNEDFLPLKSSNWYQSAVNAFFRKSS